jgi:hypothetical protein
MLSAARKVQNFSHETLSLISLEYLALYLPVIFFGWLIPKIKESFPNLSNHKGSEIVVSWNNDVVGTYRFDFFTIKLIRRSSTPLYI